MMPSHAVSAMAVTGTRPKRNVHCWSELPLDITRLIFDRLGFADFERAKSVCQSWRSASRQAKPNNQIPWLFLIPKDKNYALLFNPEEKDDKFYKTQLLGNDFGKSYCVATYKSWLLMINYNEEVYLHYPYIIDLLTRQRINLPSFESVYGLISPVLWIDEKAKEEDYLVIGMFDEENAVSIKKGDKSWKPITQLQFPDIYDCYNMVYKEDHKLYCLDHYNLTIFDFSGHVPLQVFETSVDGCVNRTVAGAKRNPGTIPCKRYLACYKNNMVVTVDGDVLIVVSLREGMSYLWEFKIYKMKMDGSSKWEEIVTLGDEAILLELGITVIAKDMQGIKSNSIYFNGSDHLVTPYDEKDIFIFNLDTNKVEQPHQSVCSSLLCSNARWFLPSFKREL